VIGVDAIGVITFVENASILRYGANEKLVGDTMSKRVSLRFPAFIYLPVTMYVFACNPVPAFVRLLNLLKEAFT
jgi:hypothetical protein